MPSEIAVPFALTPEGSIAVETDPDRQISSHIKVLVGTNPGERVMLPGYGVPLASLLFEQDNDLVEEDIRDLVVAALGTWEPGAFVTRVTPEYDNDGYGMATVNVEFTRTESPSSPDGLARNVNTVTISAAGDVREEVRG
jgi:phage baseplate assembly protein W